MPKLNPNRLLVEGKEDMRIIPQFMGHIIPWGDKRDSSPVEIEPFDGIEQMLAPGVISSELKLPGVVALGVVADANSDPKGRWAALRERAVGLIPDLPADLPAGGLIHPATAEVPRFGVWLMPDNGSPGMLETFLKLFINDPNGGLWPFVQAYCAEAKAVHGASYKDVHIDKARIHAWLAVQDPPGYQLHTAVMAKVLRPASPLADPFVTWFCDLYKLARSPE